MSEDTIDDLHAAEDRVNVLESSCAVLLAGIAAMHHCSTTGEGDPTEIRSHIDRAIDRIRRDLASTYCRPSCSANGPRADCESEDPDLCGCPCHDEEDDDD